MTCEKIFHLPGRSAEHALQGALSLSVCLAPNTMVTPVRAVSSGISLRITWALACLYLLQASGAQATPGPALLDAAPTKPAAPNGYPVARLAHPP